MKLEPAKKKKYLNILGLLAILAVIIYGIVFLLWANSLDIYHSPENITTIGIDYDFFSRPVIYQKEGFAWRKVWEYQGVNNFEDTNSEWSFEWVGDTALYLHYHNENHPDENYHIQLPEKSYRPETDIVL